MTHHRSLLTHVLLALCLCWQALASVSVAAGPRAADGWVSPVHTGMHARGDLHHHEGHDGEPHQDDSAASWSHTHAEGGTSPVAMPSELRMAFPAALPPCPGHEVSGDVPRGHLDGLDRPPKCLSGALR